MKLIKLLLLFVLCSISVYATATNPIVKYTFDNDHVNSTGQYSWNLTTFDGTPTYTTNPKISGKFFNMSTTDRAAYNSSIANISIGNVKTIRIVFWNDVRDANDRMLFTLSSTADTTDADDLQFIAAGSDGSIYLRWLIDSVATCNLVPGPTGPLPSFQWVHLVWRIDGTNLNTYVNGTLNRSISCTANMPSDYDGIFVGRQERADAPNYGGGGIDEIVLDDTIWTGTEITTDFNNLFNPVDSSPPVISQLNFSDETYQCTTNTFCRNTTDLTPSFKLALDENARCRISTSDQSYSTMQTDCTGNDTRSISCTIASNVSINLTKSTFFACNDTLGNADSTPLPAANHAVMGFLKILYRKIFTPTSVPIGNVSIFIINQITNQSINGSSQVCNIGGFKSNDTGEFSLNISVVSNYTVVGVDYYNISHDGDADTHISFY